MERDRSHKKKSKKDRKSSFNKLSRKDSKERSSKKSKRDKKKKNIKSEGEKSAPLSDSENKKDTLKDDLFNEYMRNRQGPLVHYDETNMKLTFLAKKTFKDNDQK